MKRAKTKLKQTIAIIFAGFCLLLYIISPNLYGKWAEWSSAQITKGLLIYSDFRDNKPIKKAEKLGESYKNTFGISPSASPLE